MTRYGFGGLVALFGFCAVIGVYFAKPADEAREVSCAEFLENPTSFPDGSTTGRVRVIGCEIDARYPGYHYVGTRTDDVLVAVRPAGWAASDAALLPPEENPPPVVLHSTDPRLRGIADRVLSFGEDADRHVRFAERHRERLVRIEDIEGTLETSPGFDAMELIELDETISLGTPVINARERPGTSAFGVTLLGLSLFCLALLFFKRRKWTNAHERITGGARRPLKF